MKLHGTVEDGFYNPRSMVVCELVLGARERVDIIISVAL